MKTSKNKKVKAILQEAVRKLGSIGSVVEVRSGYFFNYLLPKGIAIPYSEEQKNLMKEKVAQGIAKMKERVDDITKKLSNNPIVTMEKNANSIGILYGKVNQSIISKAINKTFGTDIQSSEVILNNKIQSLGKINIQLFASGQLFNIVLNIVQRVI